MKIKLCASLSTKDIEKNIETIKETITNSSSDMLAFPESFLQGFDSISFDYKKDIEIALPRRSVYIAKLQNLCRENNKFLSFGYYENHDGGIYDSYMTIDNKGEIISNYRRITPTWKESFANQDYREGKVVKLVRVMDKKIGIAICGDLWDDEKLTAFLELDETCDFILWPCHMDFTIEEWEDKYKEEYKERSMIFEKDLLLLNNYVEEKGMAKGGIFRFRQGKIIAEEKMGAEKALEIEI